MVTANASLKEELFEGWGAISEFARGNVNSFEYSRLHPQNRSNSALSLGTWNTFHPHFSFADAEAMVGSIALKFGSYWETACDKTKENLMSMDRSGTGRVKLSDFHGEALNGEWRFGESKEYLRQLGALDETSSWHGPRVLITNYMQGPSNCIVIAEHYRVCCANECQQHLDELENAIRAPTAAPEEILPIIERLTSGFDDDEPKLTPALRSQLSEIAHVNSGKVPIHGRLFAQWLHYVFPLECPFPHKSGTVSTISPDAYGDDYMASEEEMATHAERKGDEPNSVEEHSSEDEWMTQWSHEEELLAEVLHAPWEFGFSTAALGLMPTVGGCFLLVKYGIISTKSANGGLPTLHSHYV